MLSWIRALRSRRAHNLSCLVGSTTKVTVGTGSVTPSLTMVCWFKQPPCTGSCSYWRCSPWLQHTWGRAVDWAVHKISYFLSVWGDRWCLIWISFPSHRSSYMEMANRVSEEGDSWSGCSCQHIFSVQPRALTSICACSTACVQYDHFWETSRACSCAFAT